MESIEQTFNGTADFGRKVTVNVSRNGDLIHKCYLRATLPDPAVATDRDAGFRDSAYLSDVGHYLTQSVAVEIGH